MLPSRVPGWAVPPDLVSFLESHKSGQAVIMDLHMVNGHFQILTDAMMDIMQPMRSITESQNAPYQGKPKTKGHTADIVLSHISCW